MLWSIHYVLLRLWTHSKACLHCRAIRRRRDLNSSKISSRSLTPHRNPGNSRVLIAFYLGLVFNSPYQAPRDILVFIQSTCAVSLSKQSRLQRKKISSDRSRLDHVKFGSPPPESPKRRGMVVPDLGTCHRLCFTGKANIGLGNPLLLVASILLASPS